MNPGDQTCCRKRTFNNGTIQKAPRGHALLVRGSDPRADHTSEEAGSSDALSSVRRTARCPAERPAGSGGCCFTVPWGWCPSWKCSGGVLPQNSITPNEKHDLTHKVDIRLYAPVQGKALLSLRDRGPDLKGKETKPQNAERSPRNPRPPPELEPGPPRAG